MPGSRRSRRSRSGRPGTTATGRPRSSGSRRRGRRARPAPARAGRAPSRRRTRPRSRGARNTGRIGRRDRCATMPSIVRSAARDGGGADEAADLDVLGADRVLAAGQRLDAGDREDVRADALDVGAERDEEPAEILDVRLAGGVREQRPAGRERRRHDGVLGRHHRGLVEMDVGAGQAAAELVAPVQLDLRAEHRRRRGCADRAGGGRSRRRPAAARSRGRGARAAGRRPGTTRECGSRAPRRPRGSTSSAACSAHRVVARPFDVDAEVREQLAASCRRRGCAGRS